MEFTLTTPVVDTTEQEAIRKELEAYLDEMRTKTTEDGAPVVHYPKNFDKIAGAMSRDDVIDYENKETSSTQWSQTLLAVSALDGNIFEQGRYVGVLKEVSEDSKIERGLAEICMLDKQLKDMLKKSAAINAEITPRPGSAGTDGGYETPRSNVSTPRTARSVSSTSSSQYNTFLTRTRGDSKTSTPAGSPPSTARPEKGSTRGLNNEPSQTRSKAKMGKRNFLSENKNAVQGKPSLSLEEELRIRALTMEGDEGDALFDQLKRHGFINSCAAQLERIDTELDKFVAADHTGLSKSLRNYLVEEDTTAQADTTIEQAPSHAKEKEKGEKSRNQDNVLLQQRVDRARKDYTSQLDQAISSLRSKPLNITALRGSRDKVYRSLNTIEVEQDGESPSDGLDHKGPLSLEKLQKFMKTEIASYEAARSSSDGDTAKHEIAPRHKLDSLMRSIRNETGAVSQMRSEGANYDSSDGDDGGEEENPERASESRRSISESSVSSVPSLPSIFKVNPPGASQQQPQYKQQQRSARREELLNSVSDVLNGISER